MRKANGTSIRFDEETEAKIADLANAWGPVKPLSLAAVVIEAIDRAWKAERRRRKATKKPRPT